MNTEADKAQPTEANVITLVQPEPADESFDYKNVVRLALNCIDEIALGRKTLEPHEFLKFLDPDKDNSLVRDRLEATNIMTGKAFDRYVREAKRRNTITDKLGFFPNTALELVEKYAEKHGIALTPSGLVTRKSSINVGGEILNAETASVSDAAQKLWNLHTAQVDNISDIERELRMLNADNHLGFHRFDIKDAVDTWEQKAQRQGIIDMFMPLMFERGRATGPEGQQLWKDIEEHCFDTTESQQGLPTAVLRTFIWQVKRKALGLPVTHHLMPVLVGPQGFGKSSFVNSLCAPVKESKTDTNFDALGNDKIISIWNNHVLFLDEMSGAQRADMETIKNVITAPTVARRPMGSNRVENHAQKATFIGCSNKSVSQLIRDDTGLRRFAELVFKPRDKNAAWEFLKTVDWVSLWVSVDENGPHPISDEFKDTLVSQQEDNRNAHPVEVWAREQGSKFKGPKLSSDLYEAFRLWADQFTPNDRTTLMEFGRQMNNLIRNFADFPWEKAARHSKGTRYEWKNV